MNLPPDDLLLGLFLVFVRVGTCMMLLPGFSAAQIPPRIRLFVSFAVSLAVFPLVEPQLATAGLSSDPAALLQRIAAETMTGAVFALPIRFFIAALSFMGETVTQMIGLNPIPGIQTEDGQSGTALSAFLNAAAVTLFFTMGLHANAILAVAASFQLVPLGEFPEFTGSMLRLRDSLSDAFLTVLRLSGPFIIFAIAINLLAGIINKLTPQIPVYFIATPFLIAGGVALLYFVGDDILVLFVSALSGLIGLE